MYTVILALPIQFSESVSGTFLSMLSVVVSAVASVISISSSIVLSIFAQSYFNIFRSLILAFLSNYTIVEHFISSPPPPVFYTIARIAKSSIEART